MNHRDLFLDRVSSITEPPAHIHPRSTIAQEDVGDTGMASSATDIGNLGDYVYAEELGQYNKRRQEPTYVEESAVVDLDEDVFSDSLDALADLIAQTDDLGDEEADRLVDAQDDAILDTAIDAVFSAPEVPKTLADITSTTAISGDSSLEDIISASINNFQASTAPIIDELEDEEEEEAEWDEDTSDEYSVSMSGSLTQHYLDLQDDIEGTYGDDFNEKMQSMIDLVDESNGELIGVWNPVARVVMTQTAEQYRLDHYTLAIYIDSPYGNDDTSPIAEEDYIVHSVDGFARVVEEGTDHFMPVKKSVKVFNKKSKEKPLATLNDLVQNKRKAGIRFKQLKGRLQNRRKIAVKKTDMATLKNRAWHQFVKSVHASISKKMFKVLDPQTLPIQKRVILDEKVKKMLPRMKVRYLKFLKDYLQKFHDKKISKSSANETKEGK